MNSAGVCHAGRGMRAAESASSKRRYARMMAARASGSVRRSSRLSATATSSREPVAPRAGPSHQRTMRSAKTTRTIKAKVPNASSSASPATA